MTLPSQTTRTITWTLKMKDNTTGDIEGYVSIKTAAKLLDCSEQFFRNLVSRRCIRYVKVRKMVRIPISEFEKLIVPVEKNEDVAWDLLK